MTSTNTKKRKITLPSYTRGEERFNMISHIVGGALGVVALVLCVVLSAKAHNAFAVVASAIYGASLITLYTMSSVYHGLYPCKGKMVLRVLDHCTIYLLIGGTYTPVCLAGIMKVSPAWAWTIFGIVWGLAIVATTLTAIDMVKFQKLSMACYIGMGWCIVIALPVTLQAITLAGFLWILSGGVAYTIGACLYALGKKKEIPYMHSVFHLFVVLGSVFQFFGIIFYVI